MFILSIGCTVNPGKNTTAATINTSEISSQATGGMKTSWMTIPFTDALTGNQTTIAEMASSGKPVIMHTFAVWCPACSMQLRETAKLVSKNPDSYLVLGVDIDPRENTEMVKNHVEKNRFTGIFVSAPPEMTRSLMDTVGDQIIRSLPQTIVICNKSITYVGDGVYPEEKLGTILSQLC
jgi:thiol-disulfide isomerase/thioredoxin